VRAAPDHVVVLHDVPLTEERVARSRERAATNGNGRRCLALYVGNLEAYQGIDLLLEAAALLPTSSSVEIRVVGGPPNAVERFRARAARRGLVDRIQFLGPRPLTQLSELLATADVLLSPRSKGRNTPLKLYSYMESGRPILATRLEAHTQVLDDSTALLVEPEPEAFARGLVRLAGDEELRRRLGVSAKLRVSREYSPASFSRRLRAIYSNSLASPPRERRGYRSNGWAGVERRRGGDRRSSPRGDIDRRVADLQASYG
jgi:glycosyltransferase involved in cell wall biosynthesis